MAPPIRLTPLADMETAVTVITLAHGWVALKLGQVWEYSALLYSSSTWTSTQWQ